MLFNLKGFSQNLYSGKIESGYSFYFGTSIKVDAEPNWKGYKLNNSQNGFDFNFINGVKLNEDKLFIGLGVGYLNFEGIKGYSIFTDFDLLLSKTKSKPLINLKIGYDHIYNQYDGGTGAGLTELNFGVQHQLNKKLDFYIKAGFLYTQQAILFPFHLGIKY